MEYEVRLDIFEGPLEVLYQLLKRREIEINKVSLAEITDQYLAYLQRLNRFDLEITSEFTVIAAELIELKAARLLPGEESGEKKKPGKDLVQRLKDYKKFRKAAGMLAAREEAANLLFGRRVNLTGRYKREKTLHINADTEELKKIYLRAVKSSQENGSKERNRLDYIQQDSISVREKINEIINYLSDRPGGIEFRQLLNDSKDRMETIVTLLGVLELTRMHRLTIHQDNPFGKIKVSAGERVSL